MSFKVLPLEFLPLEFYLPQRMQNNPKKIKTILGFVSMCKGSLHHEKMSSLKILSQTSKV